MQHVIQARHHILLAVPARAAEVVGRQLKKGRAPGCRARGGGGRGWDAVRTRGRARARGVVRGRDRVWRWGLIRCRVRGCWGRGLGADEGGVGLFRGGLVALLREPELERHCGGLGAGVRGVRVTAAVWTEVVGVVSVAV